MAQIVVCNVAGYQIDVCDTTSQNRRLHQHTSQQTTHPAKKKEKRIATLKQEEDVSLAFNYLLRRNSENTGFQSLKKYCRLPNFHGIHSKPVTLLVEWRGIQPYQGISIQNPKHNQGELSDTQPRNQTGLNEWQQSDQHIKNRF